ncbi:MAG: hypothetical protein M1445_00030, partial [Bacteroidetes bacterium]|nr:hypothetical protein [Bacteroidota bacterium]
MVADQQEDNRVGSVGRALFPVFFINFIFGIHMLSAPYKVLAFSFSTSGWLILITFFAGYIFGWVF